jgi:hypothetical protein
MSKTRTANWDYEHIFSPPTKAEREKELHLNGVPCPICGLLGMKIDVLPGTGVLCDIHGIVPLEDPTEERDRKIEAAYIRTCGYPF